MSLVEVRTKPALKWLILFRETAQEEWKIHSHHVRDIPFRYSTITNCGGEIRRLRKGGKEAFAVREDRVFQAYGIVV